MGLVGGGIRRVEVQVENPVVVRRQSARRPIKRKSGRDCCEFGGWRKVISNITVGIRVASWFREILMSMYDPCLCRLCSCPNRRISNRRIW